MENEHIPGVFTFCETEESQMKDHQEAVQRELF